MASRSPRGQWVKPWSKIEKIAFNAQASMSSSKITDSLTKFWPWRVCIITIDPLHVQQRCQPFFLFFLAIADQREAVVFGEEGDGPLVLGVRLLGNTKARTQHDGPTWKRARSEFLIIVIFQTSRACCTLFSQEEEFLAIGLKTNETFDLLSNL